jgi:plastocyanin
VAWPVFLSAFLVALIGAAPAWSDPVQLDAEIRNGALVAESDTVRVTQGDDVTIVWTVDRATELHLHGYDIEVTARPDAPAPMNVEASIAGRFPIERHSPGGHDVVLYLEVHPR